MVHKEKEVKHQEGASPPPSDAKIEIKEHHDDSEALTKSKLMWVAIAIGVGILIYLLPTPEGLSERGHKFLAFLATIIILWTSEAVSIGITALMVGAGLVLFEIQPLARAWQVYAHQTVVFVFTIIMMGVILAQTTIPDRMLRGILKVGGTSVKKLSFILAMGATILSAWTHDAAMTVILLAAFIPLFLRMGLTPDKQSPLAKHFVFLIPLAAASGGGATFVGSGRSPVSAELYATLTGYTVGFTEYMIYQYLPSIIYGVGTWLAVWYMFPPKVSVLPPDFVVAKSAPMTNKEKGIVAILVTTLVLWMTSDVHGVHISVPGAGLVILCILLNLVSWKKCIAEFPWNPMMVFGAGFSLGIAMLDTGAGRWIAEQVFPLFAGAPWPIVSYGIGWLSAIITSFMANAAATALLIPVVVPMADLAGVPTLPIAMTVPLATTFVLLVIGCPPTLIAYGTGYFSQWEAFKVFFVRTFICLALAGVVQALWWPLVGMPGHLDMGATPADLGIWGVTPR